MTKKHENSLFPLIAIKSADTSYRLKTPRNLQLSPTKGPRTFQDIPWTSAYVRMQAYSTTKRETMDTNNNAYTHRCARARPRQHRHVARTISGLLGHYLRPGVYDESPRLPSTHARMRMCCSRRPRVPTSPFLVILTITARSLARHDLWTSHYARRESSERCVVGVRICRLSTPILRSFATPRRFDFGYWDFSIKGGTMTR